MHTSTWQRIDRPDEGCATRFPLSINGSNSEGFAIRSGNHLFAYINSCPHNGSPLDWVPGRFFSEDGELLVCQTHGALFAPDSGACLAGPCPHGLSTLPVREEKNGFLFVPAVITTEL